MIMEKYMNVAIQEAKKAIKYGDVPVGAVIVKDDVVIAKSYNKKESTHNVMDRFLYCRFAEDRHSHASTPLTT